MFPFRLNPRHMHKVPKRLSPPHFHPRADGNAQRTTLFLSGTWYPHSDEVPVLKRQAHPLQRSVRHLPRLYEIRPLRHKAAHLRP